MVQQLKPQREYPSLAALRGYADQDQAESASTEHAASDLAASSEPAVSLVDYPPATEEQDEPPLAPEETSEEQPVLPASFSALRYLD